MRKQLNDILDYLGHNGIIDYKIEASCNLSFVSKISIEWEEQFIKCKTLIFAHENASEKMQSQFIQTKNILIKNIQK
jgi:hypothetical protein